MAIEVEPELSKAEAAEVVREARRLRVRTSTPAWLLRVVVESFFIMFSILLALAVDSWRESRSHRRLAQQSLQIFENEIRRNLSRLDDVAPYHTGLKSVVQQAQVNGGSILEIQSIVEGLQPTVLLNTAWQTALATGALTHINVETVSALSLTYSIQERFREESRSAMPRVTLSANPTRDQIARAIGDTNAYLTQLVAGEAELRGVYQQALQIIAQAKRSEAGGAPPDSTNTTTG